MAFKKCHVEVEYRAKPEWIVSMIRHVVAGIGMYKHREAPSVLHQPRHNGCELVQPKSDLIHGLRVRAHRLVPPATHNDFKASFQLGPQFGSDRPVIVIVIDVRVVAGNRVRSWRAAQCSLTFALAGTLFGGLWLGGNTL